MGKQSQAMLAKKNYTCANMYVIFDFSKYLNPIYIDRLMFKQSICKITCKGIKMKVLLFLMPVFAATLAHSTYRTAVAIPPTRIIQSSRHARIIGGAMARQHQVHYKTFLIETFLTFYK